jgi:hypothetical protein
LVRPDLVHPDYESFVSSNERDEWKQPVIGGKIVLIPPFHRRGELISVASWFHSFFQSVSATNSSMISCNL